MSLFHFSCSRQEVQAALEYFSANSSSLPASVHQFHQTLQTQIIAADNSTGTPLLQTQPTHLSPILHLPQANIHPLPTPSPSPPRMLGVGESHLPPPPVSPTTSAPRIHTTDGVQLRDADKPSVPLPSAHSGDLAEAVLSSDEIQPSDFVFSKYAKRLDVNDLVPSSNVGLLGNTVHPGGYTEAGKSLQEGNSTNTQRKRNNGADMEDGEEGRGCKRSRGAGGAAAAEGADVAQAAPEMEVTFKGGLGRE
ncbi:hypothetical protein EV361DRAFT_956657 [Lentinula raphanica]|nr:hypothetical protein EV361DRAFT_956657 [Lentinula raphanica]